MAGRIQKDESVKTHDSMVNIGPRRGVTHSLEPIASLAAQPHALCHHGRAGYGDLVIAAEGRIPQPRVSMPLA